MGLYTFSFIGLCLLALLGAYTLRFQLAQYMPVWMAARLNLRQYSALDTFDNAAAAGFNTSNFDLTANLEEGEARSGLDEASLTEVRRIMDRCGRSAQSLCCLLKLLFRSHRVGFDEARLIRQQRIMRQNGIGVSASISCHHLVLTLVRLQIPLPACRSTKKQLRACPDCLCPVKSVVHMYDTQPV